MFHRRAFTLLEVVIVIFIILMLICLLIPARRTAGEAARRNNCSNAVRQLVLGTLNYEGSTNHLPLAMQGTSTRVTRHGPQPYSQEDGYSFVVPILSYIEETKLADEIIAASDSCRLPLNSDSFQVAERDRQSLWDTPVELLICPSFPGENLATGDYGDVSKPQVSNYHAMVVACVSGPDQQFDDDDPKIGGVLVTQATSPVGLTLKEVKDGTSKTIMLCESRAERWSAWFSGSSVSAVALPPDQVGRETLLIPGSDGYTQVLTEVTPLNYGRPFEGKNEASLFWESKRDQRDFGPSSAHSGGVVMHGYADGHVKALNTDIDATTYFRLVTRDGGEPADDG